MRGLKSFVRITSLAIIFCILLATVSCSVDKDKDGYSDLFGAMSQYYATTDPSLNVPKITVSLVVIIPAGCSAQIFDSAQSIATALTQRSDTEVKVKYDSDYKSSSKETEILVGFTDRMESADFSKDLRVNDYGYGYDGGKIIVAGRTDAGCAKAVEMFLADLSSRAIELSNAKNIKDKVIRGNYTIDKITLCGFEISEYSIVYPDSNSLDEKKAAERLADGICGLGGYLLPVVSDKKVSESTRGICVGATSIFSSAPSDSAGGKASVALSEKGHIELLAQDRFGLSLACDKLLEEILKCNNNKVSEVNIEKMLTFAYDSTDLKLFILNEAFGEGNLDTYRNTVNMINAEAPSVAVFHGCSEYALENLENNLGKIDSLGGRVLYRMADDVRLVEGKIESVADGAVYTLTFESDSGGEPFRWTLVGVIEPSEDGKEREIYSIFNSYCADSSNYPTVALFDMPDYLEDGFLAEHSYIEKKDTGYYINSCGGHFFGNAQRQVDITSDITADIIQTTVYFKK